MFTKVESIIAATIVVAAVCSISVVHAQEEDFKYPTVIDALKCDATFGTIKAALEKAGLTETLRTPDANITLFAPTDKAFEEALNALGLTSDELLESDILGDILKYHVLPKPLQSSDLQNDESLTTLTGNEIKVTLDGQYNQVSQVTEEGEQIKDIDNIPIFRINDAEIVWPDLQAENGIVHVIDRVLLPPPEEEKEEDVVMGK